MTQPLAIVGASTRSAAASAARAGFRPIAADLFADADLRSIATATRISPYPEGLLDWLRAIEPSAWMYTGALENHPELVDQMAWIAPLWGNPGEVLERVRSPWLLAEALRSGGLLFPETRESSEGLPLNGTWLAKSYRGASGSGVRVLSTEFRVPSTHHGSDVDGFSVHAPVVFQRHIDGVPCAAVYVAVAGKARLLGVTRQLVGEEWLGARGFQYAGSIGQWSIKDAVMATLRAVGDVLAERFELVGLFGVDFILSGDEVWTVEVNPRYTASVEIIERATGVRAIELHARACKDESFEVDRAKQAAHGKAILFARRNLVISEQFARFALAEASNSPWPTLADISPAGTPIDAGRPVLTVFAEGVTADEVERRLRSRVADIEKRLYENEAIP